MGNWRPGLALLADGVIVQEVVKVAKEAVYNRREPVSLA